MGGRVFNCLGQDSQEGEAAEDDNSDESGPLEANQKVKGYKEAISLLEEVQLFLNNRGYTQESLQLGTVILVNNQSTQYDFV